MPCLRQVVAYSLFYAFISTASGQQNPATKVSGPTTSVVHYYDPIPNIADMGGEAGRPVLRYPPGYATTSVSIGNTQDWLRSLDWMTSKYVYGTEVDWMTKRDVPAETVDVTHTMNSAPHSARVSVSYDWEDTILTTDADVTRTMPLITQTPVVVSPRDAAAEHSNLRPCKPGRARVMRICELTRDPYQASSSRTPVTTFRGPKPTSLAHVVKRCEGAVTTSKDPEQTGSTQVVKRCEGDIVGRAHLPLPAHPSHYTLLGGHGLHATKSPAIVSEHHEEAKPTHHFVLPRDVACDLVNITPVTQAIQPTRLTLFKDSSKAATTFVTVPKCMIDMTSTTTPSPTTTREMRFAISALPHLA